MRWLSPVLLLAGSLLLGQSFYMEAKSRLAQVLIAHTWEQASVKDMLPTKPWWWADTRAIAQLDVPRINQKVFIMQDSSSESLAFGPGHMNGSSKPGEGGHVMVAGHRDSHFAFLEQLKIGDVINTANYRSQKKRYRVIDLEVLDTKYESIQKLQSDRLTLITCYPFRDWVPGGPLRYLVSAELINEPPVSLGQSGKPQVSDGLSKFSFANELNRTNEAKPNNTAEPAIVEKRSETI